MGYQLNAALIEQVFKQVPDLTVAERSLLRAIAVYAPDETGRCWPPQEYLMLAVGVSADGLRKIYQRLASRGLDPRLPIGKDGQGRAVFAAKGHRTEFQIPRVVEIPGPAEAVDNPQRGDDSPAFNGPSDSQRRDGGPQRRDGGPAKAGRWSPPSTHPSTQESHSSTNQDHEVTDEAVAAEIRRTRQVARLEPAGPVLMRRLVAEQGPAIRERLRKDNLAARSAAWKRSVDTTAPRCPHGEPGGQLINPVTGRDRCIACRSERIAAA